MPNEYNISTRTSRVNGLTVVDGGALRRRLGRSWRFLGWGCGNGSRCFGTLRASHGCVYSSMVIKSIKRQGRSKLVKLSSFEVLWSLAF